MSSMFGYSNNTNNNNNGDNYGDDNDNMDNSYSDDNDDDDDNDFISIALFHVTCSAALKNYNVTMHDNAYMINICDPTICF